MPRFTSRLDFWYLCGAAEDAHVECDHDKHNYEFDMESISLGWLIEIQSIVKDLINKSVNIGRHSRNRTLYRLRFWHKDLACALNDVKTSPEQIKTIDDDKQKQWIGGVFDAEGTATITGSNQPMLSIYSIEFDKISMLKELLKKFLINSGIYLPKIGMFTNYLFQAGKI